MGGWGGQQDPGQQEQCKPMQRRGMGEAGGWGMSIKKGEEKAGISWGRYVEAPQS